MEGKMPAYAMNPLRRGKQRQDVRHGGSSTGLPGQKHRDAENAKERRYI
jgi:hypothetical protein